MTGLAAMTVRAISAPASFRRGTARQPYDYDRDDH